MHQLLHNKSLRLWILLVTLAVSAVFSFMLNRRANLSEDLQNAQRGQQSADFIIHNFQGVSYDKNGNQQYELQAQTLTQRSNDFTELEKPIITTREQGADIWRISADSGSIKKDQQVITLQQNVLLTQTQTNNPPILSTQHLQIFPERDLVTTDHQVQITQASGKILSTGMTGKTHSREVILERDVSGHYDPPAKPQPPPS
jgi:LPS export ABC transporter protein LptC